MPKTKAGSKGKAKPKAAKAESGDAPERETKKPKGRPKKAPPADLDALRAKAAEAKKTLDAATKEADGKRTKADEAEAAAKAVYVEALGPYREACRKAGVECELPGIKADAVAPRVRFLLERVRGGVKVAIKGRDDTEKTITDSDLRGSVGRAAKAYCERHLGSAETQGHKWAGLAGRLRGVLAHS